MHPDLASIIEADEAARRELDAANGRLAAQHARERDRLAAEYADGEQKARAALDAAVREIDDAGARKLQEHRHERDTAQARRGERAQSATAAAIAAYVNIIRGTPPQGKGGA